MYGYCMQGSGRIVAQMSSCFNYGNHATSKDPVPEVTRRFKGTSFAASKCELPVGIAVRMLAELILDL